MIVEDGAVGRLYIFKHSNTELFKLWSIIINSLSFPDSHKTFICFCLSQKSKSLVLQRERAKTYHTRGKDDGDKQDSHWVVILECRLLVVVSI